ncbi:MAG TPA: thioredoxin family protein [Spirochaetia bacterium]|nr:thioredoxin family protein [Spirochaetia bacterium]
MMIHGVLARLACAAGIIGLSLVAFTVARAVILSRARRLSGKLPSFRSGTPGILYFTTPDCVTCKAAQKPALRALEEQLAGRIQVIEVDALNQPDLARQWSVLSVPTTFILDTVGKPRQVNHGFASAAKLRSQLQRVS